MKNYDAVIIGFGKAGKTLAADMAARKMKVALIEKSAQMYGGTCINVGCIPSKSLVTSAQEAQIIKAADWEQKQTFYQKAVAEKKRVTAMLRQKNYDKLHAAGVDIYNGTAAFADDTTVTVTAGDGSEVLTAPQIFINTGASSFFPPIKGIELPRIYDSASLMDLDKLPRTLVIIGGGYIGLEFASIYAGFGSKVVILQDTQEFLPREDEDIAAEILKVMQNKGIEFHFGVKVEEFLHQKEQVVVRYIENNEEKTLPTEAVLIAAGRRPNIQGLDLEKAHINTTPHGAVAVNERLQTSNPRVWAMGDVNGGPQFTYVSLDDYRIVRSQLFGDGSYTLARRRNVPYSVFITPAYSRVGLNEKEARAQGLNIKIAKLPVSAFPKAHVYKDTRGLLKVIADADSGQLLGAMLFCAESFEMINLLKLAMDTGTDCQTLRDAIYTHPTMSEAFNDIFALL
ncbi:MAG: FAD-dependent oxidoreductase [Pseudomonadota bacterium]|nr:FAD-dependent oxidoreductase [Pseudomonadota bacterium]